MWTSGMWTSLTVLALAVVSSAAQKFPKRFTQYPSWNTRMFPVWKDGDPRYRDSWKGGQVKFIVGNDAPTLTGAMVTFTIDLEFPNNQKVLASGDVVWSRHGTVNGSNVRQSEPVYPAQDGEWNGVFPDGTPFRKDEKPSYVYVWKTWGQYWQVADGPSSSLTISTDGVPQGSYPVDLVIYHYRNKDKFIPLGYASTQFTITDQIPFAVSLTQVNDINEADLSFLQNHAIIFSISLHDPSRYLRDADITFNWDFGDGSGALISREHTVTHTYRASGSFKPNVLVQAVIPDPKCTNASVASVTSAGLSITGSTQGTAIPINLVPTVAVGFPGMEDRVEADGFSTSAALAGREAQTPHTDLLNGPSATSLVVESVSTQTDQDILTAEEPADQTAHASMVAVGRHHAKATSPKTGHAPVVAVDRRHTDDTTPDEDCVIYRYGSFCTGIDVVEGVQSLEIVQVSNTVLKTAESGAETESHVVDLTVICEGSTTSQVCSVVLDADCMRPLHTQCSMVEASPDCRLVLRHLLRDSGVFCINVSMRDAVSLASDSTRVRVGAGVSPSRTVAMVLGLLGLALAVGAVTHTYRHLKLSHSPKEDSESGTQVSRARAGGPGLFWKLLGGQGALDNRPLLQDAV